MKRNRRRVTGCSGERLHIHLWHERRTFGWQCTVEPVCGVRAVLECVGDNRTCFAGRCRKHVNVPNYPGTATLTVNARPSDKGSGT